MGRSEHFAAGAGTGEFKTRYRVGEVGMVPPPNPRGYGQLHPEIREAIKGHPRIPWDAMPATQVSLKQPIHATQATVAKSKVDRVPRRGAPEGNLPKAFPHRGGVMLSDGHHRTGHALVNGHDSIPMAVYDPANPQHVAHAKAVEAKVGPIMNEVNDHRFAVIKEHGFFGRPGKHGEASEVARRAFDAHQNEAYARIDRIKADARTRWLA